MDVRELEVVHVREVRSLVMFIYWIMRLVKEVGHVNGSLPVRPVPLRVKACRFVIEVQFTPSIGPCRIVEELTNLSVFNDCRLDRQLGIATESDDMFVLVCVMMRTFNEV